MTPDIAERAFEPFFTTKTVRKGGGLGLSMVYGFAKQSGGKVELESGLGIGTRMRMNFPRRQTDAIVDTPLEPGIEVDCTGQGETVLVVEDSKDLRNVAVVYGPRLTKRPTKRQLPKPKQIPSNRVLD